MASLGIPLPPNVVGQMPQPGQFGQPQPQQAPSPAEMGADASVAINEALNQIADMLGKVAIGVKQTRPELLEIVAKMAQAGQMLQQSLQSQGQAQDQAGVQTPPKPEGPQDVPMA